MNRRLFLALASGLLVPAPEPVRAYSFIGGWALPRWYPLLFRGSPLFASPRRCESPYVSFGTAPMEVAGPLPDFVRIGTHAELERFEMLRGRA